MEHNPIAANAKTILVGHPKAPAPGLVPLPKESKGFQTRMPVIIGEVHYKGVLPIDGLVVGQLSGGNSAQSIRRQEL